MSDFEIKPHSERTEEKPLKNPSFRDKTTEATVAVEEVIEEESSPEFMPGSDVVTAAAEKYDNPDYQAFQLSKTLTNLPAIYTTIEEQETKA